MNVLVIHIIIIILSLVSNTQNISNKSTHSFISLWAQHYNEWSYEVLEGDSVQLDFKDDGLVWEKTN